VDIKGRQPTSAAKYRWEQAKQEVEHGRCKTNEQSKGSAPFSAGVSETQLDPKDVVIYTYEK
jgi:hypothetical protein